MKHKVATMMVTTIILALSISALAGGGGGGGGRENFQRMDCRSADQSIKEEVWFYDYGGMEFSWYLKTPAQNGVGRADWGHDDKSVFHIRFPSGAVYEGERHAKGALGQLKLAAGAVLNCVTLL